MDRPKPCDNRVFEPVFHDRQDLPVLQIVDHRLKLPVAFLGENLVDAARSGLFKLRLFLSAPRHHVVNLLQRLLGKAFLPSRPPP